MQRIVSVELSDSVVAMSNPSVREMSPVNVENRMPGSGWSHAPTTK